MGNIRQLLTIVILDIIQLLTSISVDIRIYLPEKVIFTGGLGEYHFLG